MAVSATAKSLINADSYSTKWHQKRIHRKLDDRDDVLDEALQIIESHDTSALPLISSISGLNGSQAATVSAVSFAVGGAGCTSTSTITLVVGSTSIALDTPGTNTVAVAAAGVTALDTLVDAASVGDIVPIYLRVDGVLCPVVTLSVIA